MTGPFFLPSAAVPRLVEILERSGVAVYGPSVHAGRTEYRRIANAADLDLRAPMPALSLKSLFLPPTEPILHWRRRHNDVTIEPAQPTVPTTVVLGARPCDAAGVSVLDKVMGWDYRDDGWFARREATTIVAVACASPGRDCFCEAVGLGPASSEGADVLLTPTADGFGTVAFSQKGEALLGQASDILERMPAPACAPPAAAGEDRAAADTACDALVNAVGQLAWDDPLWQRVALRCHGCGACTAVCPTCHCFDIVDEPDGLLAGTRRRNWDTCQAAIFTKHASGHNPRGDQSARFRQRILHKFSIYPRRFGAVLCTGCGRCAAVCPAGQHLPEILSEVAR